MASELTIGPGSDGVQTDSQRRRARALVCEGPRGPPREKKCFSCMALEPFVGARGGVRVCFYLLSTHLNGLASVLCVFLQSENHHAGAYQRIPLGTG